MYTTYNVKVRIICKKYMYMDSNNYEFKSDQTGIHTTIGCMSYNETHTAAACVRMCVCVCVCVHVTSTCMASCACPPLD